MLAQDQPYPPDEDPDDDDEDADPDEDDEGDEDDDEEEGTWWVEAPAGFRGGSNDRPLLDFRPRSS